MRRKVKMSLLVVSVIMCAGLFPGFATAAEPVEIGVILSLTGPSVRMVRMRCTPVSWLSRKSIRPAGCWVVPSN